MMNRGESQPTETTDDAEAHADFWSIQGDLIYRHHNKPRFQFYVPKEETFTIPVSSFSFNMWQIVHCIDIDICTLTQPLPCRCLPCCFSLQFIHRQTQISCTILILTRARTWIEQALSSFCLCETRTVHTVILTSYNSTEIH